MVARLGDWIQVHSGGQFWPLDSRPDEVDIGDIAHALSLVCRFTGHVKEFYSVAQHSVLVALTVKKWLTDAGCVGCKDGGFLTQPISNPLLRAKGVVPATRCRDADGRYELLCDVCFENTPAPTHSVTSVLDARGIHMLALGGLLHDGSEAYICDIARPVKMLPQMAPYRDAERAVQACVYEAFGMMPVEPLIVKRADDVLLATEARDLLAILHPDWTVKPPKWPTLPETIIPCSPSEAERMFLALFEELRSP